MIIRTPTRNDAPAVAQLSAELGYPADGEVMDRRLGNLLQREDQHLRVVEIGGTIAGWIQVTVSESLESGRRAEIIGLVVSANMRRSGVGRALVDDAIKWAAAQKVQALVVRSNVTREASHLFYVSVGFAALKKQTVYRMTLPDQ